VTSSTRTLARIFAIFLPMPAIGTLLHELGHIAAARLLGFSTIYHFASTEWVGRDPTERESVLMVAVGPLSTLAIGTIGFLAFVALRRRRKPDTPLGLAGWIAMLAAFFWSREIANGTIALGSWFAGHYDKTAGDEGYLAQAFGVSEWLTLGVPALLALIVDALVVFRFQPEGQTKPLFVAGLAGSLAGCALWYLLLGPILLP
jgi:hypothetical protein